MSVNWYNKCSKQLKKGPGVRTPYVILRVPENERNDIMAELIIEFPRYEFHTCEVTGIWADGDMYDYLNCALYDIRDGSDWVECGRYTDEIIHELRRCMPAKTFEIRGKRIYVNLN